PDIRFVICGGPGTVSAVAGESEKIFENPPALPNGENIGKGLPCEASRGFLDAALLLSSSPGEGVPHTILQAWAAGTAVVSLLVDPDHIVKRYSLGRISLTVEQAIDDIRMLLGSEEEREAISSRAREYVAKNHTAATVISVFEGGTDG